jgi:integrase
MTLLLTGGRLNEVLGLEARDIDLKRKLVIFRANQWRPLKRGVERTVPLWPQLETEIRRYLALVPRIGQGLLFPGHDVSGAERKLWGKLYRPIERAAKAAKIEKRVTPQTFRTTFCAARLQSMDNGEPVALFTVRKEMGHFSMDMIETVYGRLGACRHRASVVEYISSDSEEETVHAVPL